LKFLFGRKGFSKSQAKQQSNEDFYIGIFKDLEKNLSNIQSSMHSPNDLIVRKIKLGTTDVKCALFFIDGLADSELINHQVLPSLLFEVKKSDIHLSALPEEILEVLIEKVVSNSEIKRANTFDELSLALLSGDTILLIDGLTDGLIIGSRGWENRSIEEPLSEGLIRGPRDGFIENLRTNIILIRRRIKDPNLRLTSFKIGRRSKRDLVMAHIEGIANPALVKEAKRRLETVDLDDAPESGYIEQWIEDNFLSPFPQLMHTERPDKVVSSLLEGKIAIILDGTPFVLIAPVTFGNTLQSPEDYYERWMVGTLIRILRYIGAFIAVFLPSIYIALVSYHPGMIPSKLAFSIAATREGVPFPAFIEAFLMEFTMEMLREAGIRLPRPIGQTIGIVGGLVIGESAVRAGIVSPIMVIVVAITAVASFSLPSYSFSISLRILRFVFMLSAGFFGLYGIILTYIMINIHLVNLKSFGVPYSAPFAPNFLRDWRDLVIRSPIFYLSKRPKYMQTDDKVRFNKEGESS